MVGKWAMSHREWMREKGANYARQIFPPNACNNWARAKLARATPAIGRRVKTCDHVIGRRPITAKLAALEDAADEIPISKLDRK